MCMYINIYIYIYMYMYIYVYAKLITYLHIIANKINK